MAHRTATQLVTRRRVEAAIGVVAPALDLLLWAGEQLSKFAGREELPPEPARRPHERELARVRSAS